MTKPAQPPASLSHRFHLKRLWVPVFVMSGISILSGTSGPQLGPVSFAGVDKLGHFIVFGLLGIAWARCFKGKPSKRFSRLVLAVVLTGLFGLLDELHQLQTPGRYFEWADLLADFMGALFWAASYLYLPRWRGFLEHKILARVALAHDP